MHCYPVLPCSAIHDVAFAAPLPFCLLSPPRLAYFIVVVLSTLLFYAFSWPTACLAKCRCPRQVEEVELQKQWTIYRWKSRQRSLYLAVKSKNHCNLQGIPLVGKHHTLGLRPSTYLVGKRGAAGRQRNRSGETRISHFRTLFLTMARLFAPRSRCTRGNG